MRIDRSMCLKLRPRLRDFDRPTGSNSPRLFSRDPIRNNVKGSLQLTDIPGAVYRVFIVDGRLLCESFH